MHCMPEEPFFGENIFTISLPCNDLFKFLARHFLQDMNNLFCCGPL